MKVRYSSKLFIFGFLFGLIFPIISVLFDIYERRINTISEILNYPSYIVLFIIPIFLGLFFYVFGKYKEKTVKIEKLESEKRYKSNLQRIIDNLNNGICVIDKNFKIIKGYNYRFNKIFGKNDYEGKSIFDTVFKNVSIKYKKEIEEFLKLIFNNITTSNEMINDVSPIRRFEYTITTENGDIEIKVLSFNIIKILNEGMDKVEGIMFIIDDITLKEKLKKEIKAKEQHFKEKYKTIVSLLSLDQEIIKRFIMNIEKTIEFVSKKLRELKLNEVNSEILNEILKKIHSLKGESFSLSFKGISTAVKELEDYIKKNINSRLELDIILNIITYFEKLQYQKKYLLQNIEDLVNTINLLSSNSKGILNKKFKNLEKYFQSVINKTSIVPLSDNNPEIKPKKDILQEDEIKNYNLKSDTISISLLKKELNLVLKNSVELFDKKIRMELNSEIEVLPEIIFNPLKEILLHLIRNSVSHGLESEDERRNFGKNPVGLIKIDIKEKNNEYLLVSYEDDGKGVDYNKILRKAIELKLLSEEESKKINKSEILKFIFEEQFSTSDDKNMVSGTGVGMSVVRDTVLKELRGKIRIKNLSNKGLKFEFEIPII